MLASLVNGWVGLMKEASLIQGASLVSGALNEREVTGAMALVTMSVRSWRVEL